MSGNAPKWIADLLKNNPINIKKISGLEFKKIIAAQTKEDPNLILSPGDARALRKNLILRKLVQSPENIPLPTVSPDGKIIVDDHTLYAWLKFMVEQKEVNPFSDEDELLAIKLIGSYQDKNSFNDSQKKAASDLIEKYAMVNIIHELKPKEISELPASKAIEKRDEAKQRIIREDYEEKERQKKLESNPEEYKKHIDRLVGPRATVKVVAPGEEGYYESPQEFKKTHEEVKRGSFGGDEPGEYGEEPNPLGGGPLFEIGQLASGGKRDARRLGELKYVVQYYERLIAKMKKDYDYPVLRQDMIGISKDTLNGLSEPAKKSIENIDQARFLFEEPNMLGGQEALTNVFVTRFKNLEDSDVNLLRLQLSIAKEYLRKVPALFREFEDEKNAAIRSSGHLYRWVVQVVNVIKGKRGDLNVGDFLHIYAISWKEIRTWISDLFTKTKSAADGMLKISTDILTSAEAFNGAMREAFSILEAAPEQSGERDHAPVGLESK